MEQPDFVENWTICLLEINDKHHVTITSMQLLIGHIYYLKTYAISSIGIARLELEINF